MDDTIKSQFEAAKQASVSQVMMKCARLINELVIARWRVSANQPNLRPVHTSLLPHIDLEGTRITVIAKRMGISKQAVGELVKEMEAMGALERIPDPEDGRAKLVRFCNKGDLNLFSGLSQLGKFEQELRAEIGDETMDQIHHGLLKLLPVLEKMDVEPGQV